MKIEFLTHDDAQYTLPFFTEFMNSYAADFNITQVTFCPPMGSRSRVDLARAILSLYGTTGFVRLCAVMGKAKLLERLPRRTGAPGYYSMRQLCRAYDVPCEPTGNPNSAEFRAAMARRAPDLVVSVACPFILKEPLLRIPPLGCINIHHAPLPRYKGMMPTFWQLYHQERSVGLTIHYMTPQLDLGAALLQEDLAILPGESLEHLIHRSKRHGAHCMARVLGQLETNSQKTFELDSSAST